jgi:hypothetical protein
LQKSYGADVWQTAYTTEMDFLKPVVKVPEKEPVPERAGSFDGMSYAALKEREILHRESPQQHPLSRREFLDLLDIDFSFFINDVPPINERFSPEETFQHIKKSSPEERAQLIPIFKDTLVRQRKALAACRIFVERSIEYDPETPLQDLQEIVKHFSSPYGFSKEQEAAILDMLNDFALHRTNAREVRARFPKDHELVYHLTGIPVSSEDVSSILVGPMTIDIETNDTVLRSLYQTLGGTLGDRIEYLGFMARAKNDDVYLTVRTTNERLIGPRGGEKQKGVLEHEREHAKNRVFEEFLNKQENRAFALRIERLSKENPGEEEAYVAAFESTLLDKQVGALRRVRDEILAIVRENPQRLFAEYESLFLDGEGNYDFLNKAREEIRTLSIEGSREAAERILIEDYRRIIRNAVGAYKRLLEEGKYEPREATAVLTDKELSEWPATVRRLVPLGEGELAQTPVL